jgi:hypothetical protein
MNAKHGAMKDDAIFVLAETLDMDPDHLERRIEVCSELFPSPENDDWWNDPQRIVEAGRIIARSAGLPHDPDQHQQPHDMGRLVRTLDPIDSDLVDNVDELRSNRRAFLPIVWRFDEWCKTLPFAVAIERIKTAGILYLQRFGPTDAAELRRRLSGFLSELKWFADTEGLHDPESGVVDVDAAALREFLKGAQ